MELKLNSYDTKIKISCDLSFIFNMKVENSQTLEIEPDDCPQTYDELVKCIKEGILKH